MKPKVSVIIVNYNHKYFPKLAIEALEKSKTNFPFEIIVVDNASTDMESLDFLNMAKKEKRITLIKSPKNIGFGKGNNMGARIAKGDYIFIHNPDVTVKEKSLKDMVDYLEKHEEIGLLGPQLQYPSGKIQESCRRLMSFWDLVLNRSFLGKLPFFKKRVNKYLMTDFDHNKIQEVDLITGAAMMIPKKVWDKVGGFDKRYFLFMEDFDLCREISLLGKKVVYYPKVVIEHYQKRLSQGKLRTLLFKAVFWNHVISAFKYYLKWSKKGLKKS